MDAIYKIIGNLDKEKNAAKAFDKLYQGKQDFAMFWVSFLTLLNKCNHSKAMLI